MHVVHLLPLVALDAARARRLLHLVGVDLDGNAPPLAVRLEAHRREGTLGDLLAATTAAADAAARRLLSRRGSGGGSVGHAQVLHAVVELARRRRRMMVGPCGSGVDERGAGADATRGCSPKVGGHIVSRLARGRLRPLPRVRRLECLSLLVIDPPFVLLLLARSRRQLLLCACWPAAGIVVRASLIDMLPSRNAARHRRPTPCAAGKECCRCRAAGAEARSRAALHFKWYAEAAGCVASRRR